MVPTTLDDWTLEALRKLLASRAFESDSFDFKEQLPHPKAKEQKLGLSADCAAFANASGGFLVFGIKNDRKLRLVGVDAKDFPEHFGVYPNKCSPTVEWNRKGIPLDNGNFVEVVSISKSWRAPHCVHLGENAFRFPKRTNKGTEYMPISEVQAMFLGLQEKRRKLEMLRAELVFLAEVVASIKPTVVDGTETSTIAPPVEVLQVLVGETFVLLEKEPKLLDALNRVRRLALDFQDENEGYQRRWSLAAVTIGLAGNQTELVTRNHNAVLHRHCEWMTEAIKKAQEHLKALLA
jgi:hypothetical protein